MPAVVCPGVRYHSYDASIWFDLMVWSQSHVILLLCTLCVCVTHKIEGQEQRERVELPEGAVEQV